MRGALFQLGDLVWMGVLPLVSVALVGILTGLAKRLFNKAGIELTDKQDDQLEGVIAWAVRAVEERSRRQAKESGRPMTGEEKTAAAFELIQSKLPKAEPVAIVTGIDASLPKMPWRQLVPTNPRTFGQELSPGRVE